MKNQNQEQKQAQATPGPWGTVRYGLRSAEITGGGRQIAVISTVREWDPTAANGRGALVETAIWDAPIDREAAANVHLIASAPDLLAACRDALICCDQEIGDHEECGWCAQAIGHSPDCFVPYAKTALAKAEGRDA